MATPTKKKNPETAETRKARGTAEEQAILQRLVAESGGLADVEQMRVDWQQLERKVGGRS